MTCGCKVVNWTAPVYGDSNTGSRICFEQREADL
jgi:hypothetical protein